MNTFLRVISAKKRLPKDEKRLYIVLYSPAGMKLDDELIFADINKIRFLIQEHNHFDVYWLEEVELQSDEEIEGLSFAYRTTIQQGEGFIKGATWMRDFVLAVTPKETNTNGN